MIDYYDTIVIGGGPAGYTAALTAARAKLSVIVLSGKKGGYMGETFSIENYPGFESISGKELTNRILKQVKANGVRVFHAYVKSIRRLKKGFKLTTGKRAYYTKTIILATGCERRTLNIPGERRLEDKGVSYCTTTDAPKFKGKIVGIAGGSDSAASAAIYLSQFAKKVYVFFRGERLSCEPKRREIIRKDDKINLVHNTNITSIKGRGKVEYITCEDGREIKLDGLFIVIGSTPSTTLAKQQKLECDCGGFVKVNNRQETSVPGIYAAGDITDGSNHYRQIITAAAEGAIAADSVFRSLR